MRRLYLRELSIPNPLELLIADSALGQTDMPPLSTAAYFTPQTADISHYVG